MNYFLTYFFNLAINLKLLIKKFIFIEFLVRIKCILGKCKLIYY